MIIARNLKKFNKITNKIQFLVQSEKNKQNIEYDNVTIDLDNIQEKLKARKKELDIKNFEIHKTGDYYGKDQKLKTADVFNFSEDFLQKKPYSLQVYGLGNGYFTVNEIWYPGSIICFPRQIFLWDISTATDIKPHSLDILDVLKPMPKYIIIGTGKDKFDIPTNVYERFAQDRRVDVLPTFEACSTFNVCVEDGMDVVAFMIPANL